MTHGIRQVIDRGMCIGCGVCEVQTSGAVRVTLGPTRLYQADLSGADEEAVAEASRVCPFSNDSRSEDEIAGAHFAGKKRDDVIGFFDDLWAGRVVDQEHLMGSSSGGLTSHVLTELLDRGVVDAVIHVGRADGSELFEYRVSRTPGEITGNRKSTYYATTMVEVLQQAAATEGSYALVGVPCFVTAVRQLAAESPVFDERIALYVGLVCGHLKSQFFAESLGWQAGVEPEALGAIDFRVKNPDRQSNAYDYEVRERGNDLPVLRSVKDALDGSWAYGAFQPEACNFCDDIFAETADVVFGDAWIPRYEADWRGTNVVVSRSERVSELLENSLAAGVVELDELDPAEVRRSQSGNFRHRRDGLRVRLADDAERGLSIPEKRVEPGRDHVTTGRVAVIRQRRFLSRLSLTSFEQARGQHDFDRYADPMKRGIRRYRLLDASNRGIRAVVRLFLGQAYRRLRTLGKGVRAALGRT